jgi:A/G-specific adenine glycosylase
MLQQTQVETVLPYYERFIERFPTVQDLADSDEADVLRLWSGLGYYNRARNFRNAARRVADDFDGRVPDDYDALIALPGIGRYMAGALMSIAFNKPFPVMDGNVRRVLSRLHGWRNARDADLWREATILAGSAVPREVNQGMMELGATVCLPRTPRCDACPSEADCAAFRSGHPSDFPAPRKRPRTVRVEFHAVVDVTPRGILMRQEHGLWEFPMLEEPPGGPLEEIGTCRHTITHHRIEVRVYAGRLRNRKGFRRVRFDHLPVTALTRKIHAIANGSGSR